MMISRVVGTVVPNRLADGTIPRRWLLVEKCDQRGKGKQEFHIACDLVNSGYGELVLVCQGSSARQTEPTTEQPIDALIVSIIDLIDESGEVVYRK